MFNYKGLNDNTEDDNYPLPNKTVLINKITSTFIYSKIDLKSGFRQVLLAKESRSWTIFITHNGHYVLTVMPFRLKKCITSTLKKKLMIYLEIIMILL